MTSYVIIGGGIIGLATARAIGRTDPASSVTVLEKEADLATHQTGGNSGVIHSGIYYVPGSAKALMCRAGAASMTAFAESRGVEVKRSGKLIVATSERELPGLEKLYRRGLANDVPVTRIGPEQVREYEPFVSCVAALHVASTAITDYAAVCRALAEDVATAGGTIRLGTLVTAINRRAVGSVLTTSTGEIAADVVINCAGLQADRMAARDRDGNEGASLTRRSCRFGASTTSSGPAERIW